VANILTVTLNPAVDVSTSVERIAAAHKLRCTPERRDAGGGGVNVARMIRRLGGDVVAVYPAGGPIGQFLQHLIEAEGVPSLVTPIAGHTRESFTVLERATRKEFRFVLPGPALSSQELRACLESACAVEPPPSYIVASGSLPPQAPTDTYAKLAAAAKERGAKVVLDCSGPALSAALEEGVFLIKPSLRELEELTGAQLSEEGDLIAAVKRLVDSGRAEIVALSMSEKGALLVTGEGVWRADAIDVPIASSVGAGDSFLAALIWALARGEPAQEAMRYALGAGAAALLSPGTELAQADDVLRLAAQAQPRRL
jgi:6-phosphofructokinase 2